MKTLSAEQSIDSAPGSLVARAPQVAEPVAPSVWLREGTQIARLMVVLVSLALVSTNALQLWHTRDETLEQAVRANANVARAVAEQVESSIVEVEHILRGLAIALEPDEALSITTAQLRALLAYRLDAATQLVEVHLFDLDGRWVSGSGARATAGLRERARRTPITPQEMASGTVLGEPQRDPDTGAWTLTLSMRLADRRGQPRGEALAVLSIAHYRQLMGRLDLHGDDAIALVLRNRIMARRPHIEAHMGTELPPDIASLLAGRGPGSAELASPMDGVLRIVSFDGARRYPIAVVMASSRQQVLAHWRSHAVLQTAWTSFLCVVLGLALHWIHVLMRRQAAAQAALQQARDQLADANARLARKAQQDALTGLANRRHLDERLAQAFKQARRHQRALSLLMVDVDEFKKYNDLYGHLRGDECLRRVAGALRQAAERPEDFVARYGGEEMVMLLPDTAVEGAVQVAEAARQHVLDLRLPHAGSQIGFITVSVGVAGFVPGADAAAEQLLNAADAALYEAKRAGRNQVRVLDPQAPNAPPAGSAA